jgi:SAM-dependent methyltransferase
MNLFDLIKRPDRAVRVKGEAIRAETVKLRDGTHRALVLPAGSVLTLANAHEFTALWTLSGELGWSVMCSAGKPQVPPPLPVMRLVLPQPKVQHVDVPLLPALGDDQVTALRAEWPTQIVTAEAFDLDLHNPGPGPLTLLCGPLVNMRRHLMPYARGTGVEVGPGLRPLVLPGPGVDVSYIEEQDPREWLNLYNKTGDKPSLPDPHILDRYARGSAVQLEGVRPGSLDFVFSNHVFEHLPNPLQVLHNWHRALRPGGMVLGVIPDPRYTFDCRQPLTTLQEALQSEAAGGHAVTRAQLERWCRYTEPRHTPDDLLRRGYSIHVSFFTPESFSRAAHELQERGWFDRVFVNTAPNHKDFAFALRRSRLS